MSLLLLWFSFVIPMLSPLVFLLFPLFLSFPSSFCFLLVSLFGFFGFFSAFSFCILSLGLDASLALGMMNWDPPSKGS